MFLGIVHHGKALKHFECVIVLLSARQALALRSQRSGDVDGASLPPCLLHVSRNHAGLEVGRVVLQDNARLQEHKQSGVHGEHGGQVGNILSGWAQFVDVQGLHPALGCTDLPIPFAFGLESSQKSCLADEVLHRLDQFGRRKGLDIRQIVPRDLDGRASRLGLGQCSHHVTNYLLALQFPLLAIFGCELEALVRAHPKDSALLQFSSQRNDVIIVEPQLALVPALRGIRLRSAGLVRSVHLHEEAFVPLFVHIPMLHRVTDVCGLDDVLQHDRGLARRVILVAAIAASIRTVWRHEMFGGSDAVVLPGYDHRRYSAIIVVVAAINTNFERDRRLFFGLRWEDSLPTFIAQRLHLRVEDVRGHDHVYDVLPKPLELQLVAEDASLQRGKFGLHQQIPRNINRILFGHTLILVLRSKRRVFLCHLAIRNSTVIDIVNDAAKDHGKLRQRIGSNAVGLKE
mmetsp:Transcript_20742/g.59103  ORF Transcript_20742/g.59103 Transcript_20742/m.59103 type:complete len:458 (-) Transcript_20742:2691-4064(-)